MTPLQLQISLGRADTRLLDIIADLEAMKAGRDAGNGISSGEQKTLDMAYARLEIITKTPACSL